MEAKDLKAFVKLSEEVDSTLTSLSPAYMTLRREEGDVAVFQGKNRLGILTPRAERNLAGIAGINYGLFAGLREDLLNETLRFQLANMNKLNYLRDPRDRGKVISFISGDSFYMRYVDLLEKVSAADIAFLRGNPVDDDKVSFLRVVSRITPADGKEILVGYHASLSSTGNVLSKFAYGIYRLICSNGMIDIKYASETIRSRDLSLIRSVYESFFNQMGVYTQNIGKVIEKSFKIKLSKAHIDESLSVSPMPRYIIQSFKNVINDGTNAPFLKEAGVEKLESLWEWANMLSSLSKGLPSVFSRETAEKNIFSWLVNYTNINMS